MRPVVRTVTALIFAGGAFGALLGQAFANRGAPPANDVGSHCRARPRPPGIYTSSAIYKPQPLDAPSTEGTDFSFLVPLVEEANGQSAHLFEEQLYIVPFTLRFQKEGLHPRPVANLSVTTRESPDARRFTVVVTRVGVAKPREIEMFAWSDAAYAPPEIVGLSLDRQVVAIAFRTPRGAAHVLLAPVP